jgi:hypothetical protein
MIDDNISTVSSSYIPILLFWMGTKDKDMAELRDQYSVLKKTLDKNTSFVSLVLPDDSSSEEIRIECINPILLNGNEYQEVRNLIDALKNKLKETENADKE